MGQYDIIGYLIVVSVYLSHFNEKVPRSRSVGQAKSVGPPSARRVSPRSLFRHLLAYFVCNTINSRWPPGSRAKFFLSGMSFGTFVDDHSSLSCTALPCGAATCTLFRNVAEV